MEISSHPSRFHFVAPNALTTLRVFCGVYAVLVTANAQQQETRALQQAALAIFFAGLSDLCDGRVARHTHTSTLFGAQFDSLADIVSFGMAPAVIAYQWNLQPLGPLGIMAAGCFTVCGAIRLARFNTSAPSENPAAGFVGLPIPFAGGALAMLVIAHGRLHGDISGDHASWILLVMLALSVLMVSNIPYWSFKEVPLDRRSFLLLTMLGLLTLGGSLRYHASAVLAVWLNLYVLAGVLRAIMPRTDTI